MAGGARKDIEIEIHGALTGEQYSRLEAFLEKNAKFEGRFERLLIDYSTIKEGIHRKLDVRTRITNGEPEIIAKNGDITAFVRSEASVKLQRGELPNAMKLMKTLGYDRGMSSMRVIKKYIYSGLEFALVEIVKTEDDLRGHGVLSRYYEIEDLADDASAEKSKERLRKALVELKLPIFSEYKRVFGEDSGIEICEITFYDFLDNVIKKGCVVVDADTHAEALSSFGSGKYASRTES